MATEPPDIPGYANLVEVGRGGFSIVYRAWQERFSRTVALKVLFTAGLDSSSITRFERECRAMGALSWHPNVVPVYDSGQTGGGLPWLAMEYLDRGSLSDRLLREGPLPAPDVLVAGVHVAGALATAHAAGTLHRDLKPENLLLGPFGEVKLGDFGIAAIEGGPTTTTGGAALTFAHAAPELLRGSPASPQSDVYGLASTLYTLIAGRPPFWSPHDETVAAMLVRVLDEPPHPLASDLAPAEMNALLLTMMAKDPLERPPSAFEAGEELQRVQRQCGWPVTDLRTGDPTRSSAPPQRSVSADDLVSSRPPPPPTQTDVPLGPVSEAPAPAELTTRLEPITPPVLSFAADDAAIELTADDRPRAIEYSLGNWPGALREQLDEQLRAAWIPRSWDDEMLAVRPEDEETVDSLIDGLDALGWSGGVRGQYVSYDLAGWDERQRAALAEALTHSGVPFEWTDEGNVAVADSDERRADDVLDRLDLGSETVNAALGKLLEACRRLQRDVTDYRGVLASVEAADAISDLTAPFGFPDADWQQILAASDRLRDAIETDASDDDVRGAAVRLAGFLAPFMG